MANIATLSSKNQVVVPKEAREALNIKAGDQLVFVVSADRVLVLEKAKSHHSALRGIAKGLYPPDYLKQERDSWD